MKKSISTLCIAIAAASISASISSADTRQRYEINIELRDGNKLIGTPRLLVDADNEARFKIGQIDGQTYEATFIVKLKDNTTVDITSMISAESADGVRRTSKYSTTAVFGPLDRVVFGNDTSNKAQLGLKFALNRVAG
jgi:hypothetical protein